MATREGGGGDRRRRAEEDSKEDEEEKEKKLQRGESSVPGTRSGEGEAREDGGDGELGQPVADKKEIQAFYVFDWANSVYSTIVVGGYLPLLLQALALEEAGFPDMCPNIITNSTLIAEAFPNTTSEFAYLDYVRKGISSCANTCVDGLCEGKPDRPESCLKADGRTEATLRVTFLGSELDPTSYASLFISFSVIFQTVAYLCLGTLGDYGPLRKKLLMLTSSLGAASCILCITATNDVWWLGGIFLIVSNVLYGLAIALINAWLPLLAENHYSVVEEADPVRRTEIKLAKLSEISAYGFAAGYLGGVIMLVLTIPVSFFVESSAAYRINVAAAGVWWFVFSLYTFRHLKSRPGPPLPPGRTYVGLSLSRTWKTIKHVRRLPITFSFLIIWFFLSDGMFLVSSVGALFANTEVDWGCINKTLGIAVTLLLVPITAGAGNWIMHRIVLRYDWSHRNAVIFHVFFTLLLPIYGFIGFRVEEFGLQRGWEMWILAVIYGFNLGSFQSYARSVFSRLIPPGFESQFFSFYEITDRGSSWIGPLVVALVQQSTGDIRNVFFYIFVTLLVPGVILLFVDVEKGAREASNFVETEEEMPLAGAGDDASASDGLSDSSSNNSRAQPQNTATTDADAVQVVTV